MEGGDTGIPGLCCAEHPGLAEIRILPQDKSIGHDGADQAGYSRGYKVFFRLYGADKLKNAPNAAIGSLLPSAIVHRNLKFGYLWIGLLGNSP
jgi:hypothetical protein